ncbi:MAG TPA: methyltransferase domain-containing protein [Polyangiaceae bacterium]|nr:methyltransferase domain-containing protein [Polyangiaceae bacterium]
MEAEPFWERAYRSGAQDPFGPPSPEVLELLPTLERGSRVLDLGCGAGRNALPLARAGMEVTALDASPAACKRLAALAEEARVDVQIVLQDVTRFAFLGSYDVVIAHGLLHLLDPRARDGVVERMRAHTSFGGANVITVFTDRIAAPAPLATFMPGLFTEGDLFTAYADWEVCLQRSYTKQSDQGDGTSYEHAVNKLVARRPLK